MRNDLNDNYSKNSQDRNSNKRPNQHGNSNYSNRSQNNQSQNRNNYQRKSSNRVFNNSNYENTYMNKNFLGNKRNANNSIDKNYQNNDKSPYNRNNNRNNNNETQNKGNNSNQNNNSEYLPNNNFQNKSIRKISSFNSQNFSNQKELPIYAFKSEILKKIYYNRVTIISGNTGCGKSTQIPQYIYQLNPKNKILMTQPRRIAAVSISKRLAEEMGEKLGEKIGYHVSMNHKFSNETKILVVTTGVFLEELIHKNYDYTHVILDEVHERDIYVDLVLAMIKWHFEENPRSGLKIILMSATIAEEKFANYLKDINGGEVPIIQINESIHHVYEFGLDTIYYNIKNERNISDKLKEEIVLGSSIFKNMMKSNPCFLKELFPLCAALIEKIDDENKHNKNGILIFIPGLAEIHQLLDYLQEFLEEKKKHLEFLILHSQIGDADQDKIFKISNKRKIILATNIAESSITIINVDFVIDFCLVKQTRYDPNLNSSFLELKWCSKANCRQRKGRIGRVNTGFYMQLITCQLYDSLDEHPVPEILRISLENPILKLKIYEPTREPNDILLKTITPPSEVLILRTIFKLEKMGALIKGYVIKDEYYPYSQQKKINYKSGMITTIGKIFAELPIDIKYSRLIMIAYSLGKIEVGITLAAILSQDRSIFLTSEKTNRYNLYTSKNLFSLGKECDFITCYIAYKKWYYDYGYLLVNTNVKFDTQLKFIEPEKYKEMIEYTKNNILELKVLKEVIKVENDIKKRLSRFGIYCTNFESYQDPKKSINFNNDDEVLILKIILTGTFYNQIYVPEYENTKNIAMDVYNNNSKDDKEQKELRTVRMEGMPFEKAKKIGEIFNAMVEPDEIIDMDYNENDKSIIQFNSVEAVKKILFITSFNNRRNNELTKFYFKNDLEAKENDDNSEEITLINLNKDLDYYYRLYYFDENMHEYVNQFRDSINFIQIIPKWEKLKLCKLVTDNYHGKITKNNSFYKYSHYSSVLPLIENFDKLIMLVFAPKYQMIGTKDTKTGKYLRYKGFQGFEFSGMDTFIQNDDYQNKENNFVYEKLFLVKFDYLITNYHLNIINEIRVMLNKIIKFKFLPKKKMNKDIILKKDDEIELSKEEYDELFMDYKTETNNIIEKIKFLLNIPKVKNISDESYQELFDYINEIKYKNKIIKNSNMQSLMNISESNNLSNLSESNNILESNSNLENNIEEEDDISEITESNISPISYPGYINSIYQLNDQVEQDDFLQLHEPLQIEEEFYFTDNNTIKELKSRNFKIKNLYNDFLTELDKIHSIAMTKTGYIVCAYCQGEISKLDYETPIMTNRDIGEHKVEKQWINDNLKEIYKIKKNKMKKKYDIDEKKIDEFKAKLKEYNIKYDNLLCCIKEQHVVGYTRNKENFIFFGSELGVKYPDLSFELIENKESFVNDFIEYKTKLKKIIEYKNSDEFKKKIMCKLCNFRVKGEMIEFKKHLESLEHQCRLKELRKEFA